MAVASQTDENKGGWSAVSTTLTSTAIGDVKSFNVAGITFSVATGGTPSGDLDAAAGSLHVDLTGNKLYINTSSGSGTTWTVVGAQS
jgi:hypothetical protein